MNEPTTYQTAAGYTVTLGYLPNAMYGPAHTYECNGCDGIRGYKTAEQADCGAQKHTARCTDKPGGGVR